MFTPDTWELLKHYKQKWFVLMATANEERAAAESLIAACPELAIGNKLPDQPTWSFMDGNDAQYFREQATSLLTEANITALFFVLDPRQKSIAHNPPCDN